MSRINVVSRVNLLSVVKLNVKSKFCIGYKLNVQSKFCIGYKLNVQSKLVSGVNLVRGVKFSVWNLEYI